MMNRMTTDKDIFSLDRPSRSLLWLYLIRSLFSGPLVFLFFPFLVVRYLTLHYKFDDQGVSMRYGILFRREVNVTYARIQDIHLTSGIVQRWLGLADLQIQTASGSAGAEITIEGFHEFDSIRDFLYSKMRGTSSEKIKTTQSQTSDEAVALLHEIAKEVKTVRELMEQRDV